MRPANEHVAVSVVIPCWRCAGTVEHTVASVAAQTRVPTEVILVDDASGDETLAVLHLLAKRYPREWIKVIGLECNGGPGTARNRGWDAATSPYVAFLDADDAWYPRKIELQYGWMSEHPDVMVTGHICTEAPRAGWSGSDAIASARPVPPRALLFRNAIAMSTAMLRNEPGVRFAGGKRYAEDYLLWLELALSGRQLFVLEATLAHHHKAKFGAGGLSGGLWKMEEGELDTFNRLRRAGKLSLPAFVVVALFSLMKFARRWLITRLRAR